MSSEPQLQGLLDEDVHQALDLLEDLGDAREGLETLRREWPPALEDPLLESLAAEVECSPAQLRRAVATIDELLDRAVPTLALRLLEAAARVLERAAAEPGTPSPIARTVPDALRPLETIRTEPLRAALASGASPEVADLQALGADLSTAMELIRTTPELAFAVRPAVATLIQILGLPRGGALEGLLEARQAIAPAAPTAVERGADLVSRLARAAYLPAVLEAEGLVPMRYVPAHPALARFRLECVEGAGPETRARALAGDAPDLVDLARELLSGSVSDLARIRTFDDLARQAREAAREEPDPTRGRKFTWQHAILLALLIVLSVYYYLGR